MHLQKLRSMHRMNKNFCWGNQLTCLKKFLRYTAPQNLVQLHSTAWMDIITPFIYPFKNTTSNDNFLPKQELINKMLQHKPKMVRLAHMLHSNDLGLCFETHPNSWYLHLLAFHLHDLQLYTLHQFDRPSPVSLVKSASWEIKERKNLWWQCILSPIVLLGIVCLLGLSGKTKMVS